ncbi:MAG TPA: peptidase S1, partial [Bacillus bacterium]|nr:peptidase S1 [Bacillus sp. (in: firmicutes)]
FKAGLKEQDVIVAINGEKVGNSADLRRYMYTELKTGEKAELKIYRDGEQLSIEVTLAANTAG